MPRRQRLNKILAKSSFIQEFREDLRYWARTDRQAVDKIFDLIEEIIRNPFEGAGKPEPLKYDLNGCWSRRIT